eukprot:6200976-Pleurochrysis_carterae.AAC.3
MYHALSSEHGGRGDHVLLGGIVYRTTCIHRLAVVYSPPQERKRLRFAPPGVDRLRHASALSCARADAMPRMLNTVAKLHLVSAACCLTITLILIYWIHGSRVLGLAESANPTHVTHASGVNTTPMFEDISLASARAAFLVPRVCLATARRIIAWDERMNDKAVDALYAAPGLLFAGLLRTIACLSPFAPTTSPPPTNAAPRAPTQRPRVMSTPLASNARVMLASSAPKRPAPKQTAALWATQRRFRGRQWMHLAHSSSHV